MCARPRYYRACAWMYLVACGCACACRTAAHARALKRAPVRFACDFERPRRCSRLRHSPLRPQHRTTRHGSAPHAPPQRAAPQTRRHADCSGLTAHRYTVPFAKDVRRALRVALSGQAGGGACRRKRPKSLPDSTGMLGGCLTLSIMSSAPQLRPSAAQRSAALPMRQTRMQSCADVARPWA